MVHCKIFFFRNISNYLVFNQLKNTLNLLVALVGLIGGNLMEENVENMTKSDSNFTPTFVDHHVLPDMNFNGYCLINNICISKKVINIYISYTLSPWLRNLNTDFKLKNCFFGSVQLTNNADPDKYKYGGFSIGFDSRSEFLSTDMNSSVHIDNEGKDILILGEIKTQGLDYTT